MRNSKLFWLSALLVVQAACATFFLFDALSDWLGQSFALSFRHYHSFEMVVSFALVAGLVATILQIRDMIRRQAALRQQVQMASGALGAVINQQFADWKLSAAERDVALLSIKGMSVSDIATLRQTKEGTVKAQSAAVYRKANVSGRLQLISLFIEDLLVDPLLDPKD